MKNRFRFSPIQPELNHLVLGYHDTLDEYSLINLQHDVNARNYKTVFYEEDLTNIDLKNYKKERYYTEEERERMEMLKLMEQLNQVPDRRIIHQEIYKLSKEDLADFVHLAWLYMFEKPCTYTIGEIATERMNELNEE